MTKNNKQKLIISIAFIGILLMYFFLINIPVQIVWYIIGGILILALSFLMLKSRNFLIFSTALFLMLAATQFRLIFNIMQTIRWIPYIIFVFIFFTKLYFTKKLPRKVEGFDVFLFIMITMMFISAFYSINPTMTIKRAGTFILLYISIFWVIYPEIQTNKDAEEVIDLILYASFIPYSISIILLFFPPIAFFGKRFMGYFLNPNTIGIFTTVLFPIILWKALEKKSQLARILLLIVLSSLILSGSRAGLLGSFIGGSFYLLATRKKYGILAAFLGLVIIVFMFIAGQKTLDFVASYMRLGSMLGTTENVEEWNIVASGRIEKWKAMFSLIKERPLLGYGFGTEDLLYHHFNISTGRGLYAASNFLGITVQLGIVGFMLFFSPLLYLLFNSVKSQDALIYAIKGMIFGGLIVGIFETWIYSVGNAFTFPFWIGVVIILRLNK